MRDLTKWAQLRLGGSRASDLTQYDRMEELAAANRRKDEFLAMLSHELRSPLASIHYGLRLLSGQLEDAARQRMQTLVERQLHRMTRLVDELLDFSRITNGRLNVQRERVDLRIIVGHAVETLMPEIEERAHHLSAVMPDAPVWLQGDSMRLEQWASDWRWCAIS
jgi:signal transduction histidine kinase